MQKTRRWRKADSNRWSHFDRDAFQNTILGPGAAHRFKDRSASARGETDVSNPLSSSRQSVSISEPLSKVENPAFGAGLRGWLGDRSTEMDNGEQSGSTLPARMRFSIDGWDASLPLIPREAD